MRGNKRKLYLDVLRILAIFLVLFTHTGTDGAKIYTISGGRLQFWYATLDCIRTINNPILFMISGALLLDRDESIGVIWKKRVIRFLITLVVFSYIQAMWNSFYSTNAPSFDVVSVFKALLCDPIRMQYWYIYSYISFLVMLPFLRSIAQKLDKKTFVYLLLISIVTKDLFPLISLKMGIMKINFSVFLNSFTTLYPLLGYYLDCHSDELMKKVKYSIIIVVMFIGIAIAAKMTLWNHDVTGNWEEKYITLFYTITAVVTFLLIKKLMEDLEKSRCIKAYAVKFIEFASSTTFGIYLLENILEKPTRPIFNVLVNYMPRIFACGIWLIATMLYGNIVVGLMKRIPGLKKLI